MKFVYELVTRRTQENTLAEFQRKKKIFSLTHVSVCAHTHTHTHTETPECVTQRSVVVPETFTRVFFWLPDQDPSRAKPENEN